MLQLHVYDAFKSIAPEHHHLYIRYHHHLRRFYAIQVIQLSISRWQRGEGGGSPPFPLVEPIIRLRRQSFQRFFSVIHALDARSATLVPFLQEFKLLENTAPATT